MIAIINYEMGNLQSVANILDYVGAPFVITNTKDEIAKADKIILPGVGAFGQAMDNLRRFDLIDFLADDVMNKKKPFLGICLGMQILAEKGYEGGEHEGLGWIQGEVKRLEPGSPALPIPHMGWNEISPKSTALLYGKSDAKRVMYFVHSYHLICEDEQDVSATVEYGVRFTASIEKGNIFATQYHPEKSQRDGIQVIKNFISFV